MENSDVIRRLAASRRILVLGSSGSGKTTFALQLAKILNIELIHLDAHFWQPGWKSTPQEEWRCHVADLLQLPAWIMDGMYESTLALRLPAADGVVVLERGRIACLWGVIKRKLTIADDRRPDAPPGQPVDWPFLRYVWRYPQATRPLLAAAIAQYGESKPIVILHNRREIAQMLQSLDEITAASRR